MTHTYVNTHIIIISHTYICACMYIPITVTVPRVLVVFGVDRTTHWKVVVPLIENTVNEYAIVVLLFC